MAELHRLRRRGEVWTLSWEAIDRCPNCGSPAMAYAGYDKMTGDLIEQVTCLDCGCSYGGAAYWK